MLVREGIERVCGTQVFVEFDAGAPAGAVEKRVSALAGGDLFGAAGGDIDIEGRDGVFVGVAVGDDAFPALDRKRGARGAEASVKKPRPSSKRAPWQRGMHRVRR